MPEAVLTKSLMRSLSLFRWATLVGAWVGVVVSRTYLIHPLAAVGALGAATVLTGWLYRQSRTKAEVLVLPGVLASEVALGVILLLADGWVYAPDRPQSLPWAWPAAGIAAVGIARGGQRALGVAVLVGAASLTSEVILLGRFATADQLPAALSKVGLWLLVGGIAGPLTDRLRRAEQVISLVRTREEVGRHLHDGVLQTLAVVQRRSDDAELVALAREQEQSLRHYLSDQRIGLPALIPPTAEATSEPVSGQARSPVDASSAKDLEPTLRSVAIQVERLHPIKVAVVVAGDCEQPDPPVIDTIAAVVGEALTNAAKHGQAETATVYVEPADTEPWTVAVSVKDNGSGFDPSTMVEGIGWSRSIRGRVDEAGGQVEVTSQPGRGAEVRLWV